MDKSQADLLMAIENEISGQFIFSIVLSALLVLFLIGMILFSKNKKNALWLMITISIVLIVAVAYSVWIGIAKSDIQTDLDNDRLITYNGEFSFSKASQSNGEYHSIKITESDGSTVTLKLYHHDKLKEEFPLLGGYSSLANGNYCGEIQYAPHSKIVLAVENLAPIQ